MKKVFQDIAFLCALLEAGKDEWCAEEVMWTFLKILARYWPAYPLTKAETYPEEKSDRCFQREQESPKEPNEESIGFVSEEVSFF